MFSIGDIVDISRKESFRQCSMCKRGFYGLEVSFSSDSSVIEKPKRNLAISDDAVIINGIGTDKRPSVNSIRWVMSISFYLPQSQLL